ALMFLKNYSGLSDKKLIEHLNGNIEWQFFCGIYLGFNRINNYKIVSQIRGELASKLNIEKTEKALYDYWKPHILETKKVLIDATCYESEMRYPTDVKLLWESVEWCHQRMVKICQFLSIPRVRTKYLKWMKCYVNYSKMRRKTKTKKNALRRASLLLINKLMNFLEQHEHFLNSSELKKMQTIKEVYDQQYAWFYKEENPKNRIVSLHKEYVRPIVRGKEINKVEFGPKVNKIQIDGISFIEHLSFDAFHEGIRFKDSIYKTESLTGTKTKIAGADAIFATNENRRFATKEGIETDFKPKGPKAKNHKQRKELRTQISKERASRLEGSFGKDKECYHLRKIKAKTEQNEILWIFFGIHVGNALEIGRRKTAALVKKAA
ncbi:MAG: transposase, partial [Dysgonamonadaceae bacterium]|nr:transposase [Dysgonamonadaceae bacterium]